MTDNNPVVGHKTFADGHHEPLRQSEADALWEAVERDRLEREAQMPDSLSALTLACSAQIRLRDLGWREGVYCPKDGSQFAIIMWGSTGIHSGHYMGKWPEGHIYCGDFLYRPDGVMWKATSALTATERETMDRSVKSDEQFMERQIRMFEAMDEPRPGE